MTWPNRKRNGQGRKDEIPRVICVGRLVKNKGVENLIKAMAIVVKRVPSAKLSIVGRGFFESKLRELVAGLDLEESVTFHGYVPENEKIKLLQRSHVLVMPSLREGWATPVIEANACGTPSIGTNVPGVKSTIINGETGFLVPYGDVKELASKIITILNNKKIRKRMGEASLRWAQKFDQERTIQTFTAIFRSLYFRNPS